MATATALETKTSNNQKPEWESDPVAFVAGFVDNASNQGAQLLELKEQQNVMAAHARRLDAIIAAADEATRAELLDPSSAHGRDFISAIIACGRENMAFMEKASEALTSKKPITPDVVADVMQTAGPLQKAFVKSGVQVPLIPQELTVRIARAAMVITQAVQEKSNAIRDTAGTADRADEEKALAVGVEALKRLPDEIEQQMRDEAKAQREAEIKAEQEALQREAERIRAKARTEAERLEAEKRIEAMRKAAEEARAAAEAARIKAAAEAARIKAAAEAKAKAEEEAKIKEAEAARIKEAEAAVNKFREDNAPLLSQIGYYPK